MDLLDYRRELDELDAEMVRLFVRRMEIVQGIGQYKKEHHLPVLDAQREREKLDAVAAMAPEGLQSCTKELYQALFALSRRYQEENS